MKRALSMVFVLMMFLVLQPFTASAALSGEAVSGDWTINQDQGLWKESYHLSADATLKNNGEVSCLLGTTIDLNGHTLTIDNGCELITSYDLTIIDSSEAGTGKIQGEGSVYVQNRTLKANSGTIASAVLVGSNGTVSVDEEKPGAKFTSTVTNRGTIAGAKFTGTITNEGTINGGNFTGTVNNGHEYEFYFEESGYHYVPRIGRIAGGQFYGAVTNSSFPHEPDYRNYIFGGWFYESSPTGNVIYQDPDSGSTPVYKITYQSKNGTFLGMNVLPTSEDSSGVTPNYDYMPEGKTASTFDGWYTDADCTHKAAAGMTITADTTLYGKAIDPEKSAEIEEPWDNPFKDVKPEDWFYESVKFVHKRGWMNGKTADTFAPYDTFTRAEVSAVLYNRAGTPEVNTNRVLYADVPTDAWYTKAVYWMTDEGNATGAENGHFFPNSPVTREELATMLYNAVGRPETNGTLFQFLDAGDASDWAVTPLCWAAEQGIMIGNGDGTLSPGAYSTRAEAAAILRNFGRAVLNS